MIERERENRERIIKIEKVEIKRDKQKDKMRIRVTGEERKKHQERKGLR